MRQKTPTTTVSYLKLALHVWSLHSGRSAVPQTVEQLTPPACVSSPESSASLISKEVRATNTFPRRFSGGQLGEVFFMIFTSLGGQQEPCYLSGDVENPSLSWFLCLLLPPRTSLPFQSIVSWGTTFMSAFFFGLAFGETTNRIVASVLQGMGAPSAGWLHRASWESVWHCRERTHWESAGIFERLNKLLPSLRQWTIAWRVLQVRDQALSSFLTKHRVCDSSLGRWASC